MTSREYDVAEFGAVGDGVTLDTHAIQTAIDTCYEAGGGTVYFAPGKYLSGTLKIKSNISLYLAGSATLLGSPDIKDYEPDTSAVREGMPSAFSGGYLIYAENAENIAITGTGTIDGQGRSFWKSDKFNESVVTPKDERPRAMIYMKNCSRLLFRDISLNCSPCYTIWLIGCDRVNIDGISITNPYDGPNTDGLDIDCCHNVHISNCHIDAGDDCIALKSDMGRLGKNTPCENITVTNCTLSSTTCAVRVGYEGDAPIRNCVFSNLSIYNTRTGIDILSIIPSKPWCMIHAGAPIEGILFDNIVMENVSRPIYLWMGNETDEPLRGKIQNIKISNVIAYATNTCYIGGCPEASINGVELSNIKLILQGNIENPNFHIPDVWGESQHSYGLFCRYVNSLKISDLLIDWTDATGNWQNEILVTNTKNVEISGFSSSQYKPTSAIPVIHLCDVQGASICGCKSETIDTFLLVDGNLSQDINVIGNDLSHAANAFKFNDVDDSILFETANRLSEIKPSSNS